MSKTKTKEEHLQLIGKACHLLDSLTRLLRDIDFFERASGRFAELLNAQLNDLKHLFEDITGASLDSYPGFDTIFGRATEKFNRQQRLSREEYYLLVASRVISYTGPDGWDGYGRFDMHFYQDDKIRGYIDPESQPDSVGKKVRIHELRPEQKKYFSEHAPDIYQRFRK